jgi:ankyrin repeat protein
MNNHTAIVRLLLDHGADVGARDANGQTALGSSEDSGRTRADGGSGAELAASFSESLEEEDEEALEREAANKKLQHDQIQQLLRNG